MHCCETCGTTQDLRLYEVPCGDHVERLERRWWCLECSFSARRLGVNAEPAPAWIERAALHQLPMKPLSSARNRADVPGPNPRRLARILASHLAGTAEPEALALKDDDRRVDELVRPVVANATG
jgi:hypothetical protein